MTFLYIVFIHVVILIWNFNQVFSVPPVINNLPNSTTVHESTTTEILLYTIDVTDADGDSITCSFGPGTTPGSGSTKFLVKFDSGAWGIYTVAGTTYDFNSQPDYTLEIDCDANGDTDTGSYTVYLSENQAPVIHNLPTSITVSTLTTAVGDNIFAVSTTDAENDQITNTISCTPATPACPFTVFNSGAIQLNADIAAFVIPGYDVTVNVDDDQGKTGISKVLTVLFSDINNPPQIQNLGSTMSVSENTALGDTVVTTICTDSDAGDTLIYSITCTPTSGSTYFIIDSTTGVITTSPTSLINYEYILSLGSSSYSCTVTCNDGRTSDTATVGFDIIDVNESPQFSQHSYSLSADEGPGGTVIQITPFNVIDEDNGDNPAFTLDCGTATGFFSIDTSSGIISYSIDYDVDDGLHPASATCTVTATDNGGVTATAAVAITINNLNDNAPVFIQSSYVWLLSETNPVGTTVGTVTASDADIGTYGTITYSLDQSTMAAEYFEIDQTGVMKIKTLYGPGVTPTFYAIATDGGGNETRVPITVIISASTTTTTTVATTRYKSFFDDPRNIAWFTALCVLLLITVVVIVWVCVVMSSSNSPACSDYRFRCCSYEDDDYVYEPRKPRNWGEGHRSNF